jgi:hypothetical protein
MRAAGRELGRCSLAGGSASRGDASAAKVYHREAGRIARQVEKVKKMAKGQKRSNKEVKKPKQVKPKERAAASVSGRMGELQKAGQSPKK